MAEKPKPKIPFDEVHQVLESILKDGKYLVIAMEKDDIGNPEGHAYTFTNFKKEEAKKILLEIRDGIVSQTTIDSYLKNRDVGL